MEEQDELQVTVEKAIQEHGEPNALLDFAAVDRPLAEGEWKCPEERNETNEECWQKIHSIQKAMDEMYDKGLSEILVEGLGKLSITDGCKRDPVTG